MEKVLEGKFPAPPPHYSQEMHNLVATILQRDADKRPTVRELFELPYIREGLRLFLEAVDKSPKIAAETKAELKVHVDDILSTSPAAKVDSRDIAHEGPVKKLGGPFGRSWKVFLHQTNNTNRNPIINMPYMTITNKQNRIVICISETENL